MLVISPLTEGFIRIRITLDICLSAIFVSMIYAISRQKRVYAVAGVLVLPMFASIWSAYFIQSTSVILVGRICGVLFFAFTMTHILRFIYRAPEVDKDLIMAAAVVYLLLALMWSFVYSILEIVHPGSFTIPESKLADTRFLFVYYSLVTITTLGYGDITPLTGVASSFSTLEAVIGQLYVAVQIAWLVGVHVSHSLAKKNP
jgi:hypothetical protein